MFGKIYFLCVPKDNYNIIEYYIYICAYLETKLVFCNVHVNINKYLTLTFSVGTIKGICSGMQRSFKAGRKLFESSFETSGILHGT